MAINTKIPSNVKNTLKITAAVLLLFALLNLFLPYLTSPDIVAQIEELGIFGPLIFMAYIVSSHVFAPLSASPMALVGFTVFGFLETTFYMYLAGLVSAAVNFFLARRFGRGVVEKLAGKAQMNKIDKFTTVEGDEFLIMARLFGAPLFDVVSYAFGLTNISFRKYMAMTALISFIPTAVFAYFFRNLDFADRMSWVVWGGSVVILALIFAIYLRNYFKRNP